MESKEIKYGTNSIEKSLLRLNDEELVHVFNTLLESKWSTNDMWDEKEGISMDDWAESVRSEIEFVRKINITKNAEGKYIINNSQK